MIQVKVLGIMCLVDEGQLHLPFLLYNLSCLMTKPTNDCAASEDSDQPGHPPYLPTECTAKTLIRLGGCPG